MNKKTIIYNTTNIRKYDESWLSGKVDTFANLPEASTHNWQFWYVLNTTWNWLLWTQKKKWIWVSNGVSWEYVDSPLSASIQEAQEWISNDSYISPYVLNSLYGNVDNTSDINKPISNATQTALNSKQNTLVSWTNIKTINWESVLGAWDIEISWWSSWSWYPVIKPWYDDNYRTCPFYSNPQGRISIALTANRIYYRPFILNSTEQVNEIWFIVSNTVWWQSKIGIYDTIDWKPWNLLCTSDFISKSTTWYKSATVDVTLTAWVVYWFAYADTGGSGINAMATTSSESILAVSVTANIVSNYYYDWLTSWWTDLPSVVTSLSNPVWPAALPALFFKSR